MIKDANITILVKDMDDSISFYQSIGFVITSRWGHNFTEMSAAGISVGLQTATGNNQVKGSGSVALGFTTDDFGAVKGLLEKFGIPSETTSEKGGMFLHFSDPDGTALYFKIPG